jgi:hypothetical protein
MQSPNQDALGLSSSSCDPKRDPQELTNLIGNNPDREKHRAQAERMKGLLVAWLDRIKAPNAAQVKARLVMH